MLHAPAALQWLLTRFPFCLDHCRRPGTVDCDGVARLDGIRLRNCALYSVVCSRHLRLGNLSARYDEPRHLARGRLTNQGIAGRNLTTTAENTIHRHAWVLRRLFTRSGRAARVLLVRLAAPGSQENL